MEYKLYDIKLLLYEIKAMAKKSDIDGNRNIEKREEAPGTQGFGR